MRHQSCSLLYGLATVALVFSGASVAQTVAPSGQSESVGELQEVVVTAERRSERLQSLPIAISAYSSEALESRGVLDVSDLQHVAPSVQVGDRSGTSTRITIRGIGTELANIGGEPSVAMSVDGVTYASPNLYGVSLLDVNRIEVLRGPQGTISGRNATAGAINIISNTPTAEFEEGVQFTAGNYHRIATEAYLSGPLAADQLLGRLAVRTDRADGWITNTLLDQTTGSTDILQMRGSLQGRVGDNFSALVVFEALKDHSAPAEVEHGPARPEDLSVAQYYGVPGFNRQTATVQQNFPSTQNTKKYQTTLKLNWDLNPSTRLVATTGFVDFRDYSQYDLDQTGFDAASLNNDSNPSFIAAKQFSQEMTLTADLSQRLDLIVGGLYLRNDEEQLLTFGLPFIGLNNGCCYLHLWQPLTSWGGYAQLRFRFTDALQLTVGARETRDTKDYQQHSSILGGKIDQVATQSWSAMTPRVSLDYEASKNLNLYASVSKGYKAGGFETGANPLDTFKPEYVWNYEAGVKGRFFDRRVSSAVSVFYMRYSDLQQSIWGLTAGSFLPVTINAASANIKGVEAEADALITKQLRLTADGTYLDARYKDLNSYDPVYPELGIRNLSGNQLVRAPKWQTNIAAEYTLPLSANLEGVLNAAYSWQSKAYFDIFNDPINSQGSYGLLNASAAVRSSDGKWRFTAFVKNATNRYYVTNAWVNTSWAPVPVTAQDPGMPRTYGVSVSQRF